MVSALQSVFAIIHVLLRGKTFVKCDETPNKHVFQHELVLGDGTRRVIGLLCRQYRYVTHYRRWYIPRQVNYIYTVELVQIDDDEYKDYHEGHYPQLCPNWWFLHRTKLPHVLAINAHLDKLKRYNKG